MFKLLATTAIIAVAATSASAWTDAKTLINNLNTVYSGVDGQSQFNNLQGNGGELNQFVNDVTAGVTHISLKVVSADDVAADASLTQNTIVATLNEGKTLAELTDSAGNLVNRINYDLFYDDKPSGGSNAFDTATDYTVLAATTIDPTTTDSQLTNGTNRLKTEGLVGNKVFTIVDTANTLNTALISADGTDQAALDASAAANSAFIDAYNNDTGGSHFGVDVGLFKADITEVNSSIVAAGGANFFGNVSGIAIDGTNAAEFTIPGIKADGTIELAGGQTFTSLLDWATAP